MVDRMVATRGTNSDGGGADRPGRWRMERGPVFLVSPRCHHCYALHPIGMVDRVDGRAVCPNGRLGLDTWPAQSPVARSSGTAWSAALSSVRADGSNAVGDSAS